MTDREFHEIQLSGKQLVFLFISAVVLAVVIFLLGVAVGRGVRDTVSMTPVEADAGAGDTVVPAEPAAQPAQELGYHDLLAGASGTPANPPAENTPPPTPPVEPPVTPPAAAESQAAPTPAAAERPTGGWFLQVGAYSGRSAADAQVAALKKLDVPAFVLVPGAGAADRLFRVRIGPYATQAEADGIRTRLTREGFTSRVTR